MCMYNTYQLVYYCAKCTLHIVLCLILQVDGDSKELFSIGQNRTDPCLLPISRKDRHEIVVLKDEKQVCDQVINTFCTCR